MRSREFPDDVVSFLAHTQHPALRDLPAMRGALIAAGYGSDRVLDLGANAAALAGRALELRDLGEAPQ